MIKSFALLAAGLLATPALAAPLDGSWVADVNSLQLSMKPKLRSLDHGIYRCGTCVPAYSVAADGKFHAIKGDPYIDEQSVQVVDAHTVKFATRGHGKLVNESTATVSADGKTLLWNRKGIAPNGVVTNSEATDVRIGAGPKGAHLISGSWRNGKIAKMDASALTVSFRQEGNVLHMSAPTGETYAAKIGGPAVPIAGDTGGTMAAVRKTGPNTWVETDTRKGKVVSLFTMRLTSPTTMAMTNVDTEAGRTTQYVAHRK